VRTDGLGADAAPTGWWYLNDSLPALCKPHRSAAACAGGCPVPRDRMHRNRLTIRRLPHHAPLSTEIQSRSTAATALAAMWCCCNAISRVTVQLAVSKRISGPQSPETSFAAKNPRSASLPPEMQRGMTGARAAQVAHCTRAGRWHCTTAGHSSQWATAVRMSNAPRGINFPGVPHFRCHAGSQIAAVR